MQPPRRLLASLQTLMPAARARSAVVLNDFARLVLSSQYAGVCALTWRTSLVAGSHTASNTTSEPGKHCEVQAERPPNAVKTK